MERIQEQGGEIHDTSTIRNIELGHQPGSKPLMYAWARALGIEDTDIQILPIAHGYDRDSQAAALTA